MSTIRVLDGRVWNETLFRIREMLYGAYRSCDPSGALSHASEVIGRTLTHEHVLRGELTEREARLILQKVGSIYPDTRDRVFSRVTG